MPTPPDETKDQSEHIYQTEVIPQQPDDTARIDADHTARMPPAASPPSSPPEVEPSQAEAPVWAALTHEATHESAVEPAVDGAAAMPPANPVRPAHPMPPEPGTGGGPWWKGRLALAGAGLAAGLLLGGAVGATTAVAIGDDDRGAQVSEGVDRGRGGFADQGQMPGGRHGGGRGEMPDGDRDGQGQLPGGGTSVDPDDANDTAPTT